MKTENRLLLGLLFIFIFVLTFREYWNIITHFHMIYILMANFFAILYFIGSGIILLNQEITENNA